MHDEHVALEVGLLPGGEGAVLALVGRPVPGLHVLVQGGLARALEVAQAARVAALLVVDLRVEEGTFFFFSNFFFFLVVNSIYPSALPRREREKKKIANFSNRFAIFFFFP